MEQCHAQKGETTGIGPLALSISILSLSSRSIQLKIKEVIASYAYRFPSRTYEAMPPQNKSNRSIFGSRD